MDIRQLKYFIAVAEEQEVESVALGQDDHVGLREAGGNARSRFSPFAARDRCADLVNCFDAHGASSWID